MSQQFQADGVANATATTLTNGLAVQVALGNFITPPFGNCKAVVRGSLTCQLGSVPTLLLASLFRNPNAENVQVGNSVQITATVANAFVQIYIEGTDPIPDGRAVQYQLLITASGTGTNGAATHAAVSATLLSG